MKTAFKHSSNSGLVVTPYLLVPPPPTLVKQILHAYLFSSVYNLAISVGYRSTLLTSSSSNGQFLSATGSDAAKLCDATVCSILL